MPDDATTGAAGNGQRHAWMDSWCATLARILAGKSARRILDNGLPADAGLALMPSWVWREPLADVGRKSRAAGGGSLLLPLQVVWEPGPLIAVGDGPVEAAWAAEGLGFREEGVCTLHPSGSDVWGVTRLDDAGTIPAVVQVGRLGRDAAARAVERYAADGNRAWWEAVMSMERYVEQAVTRAAAHVSMDVGGGVESPPLLDKVALEQVTSEMLLGTEGNDRSPLKRIVDHSLQPGVFAKVDPQRYVTQTLRREAQQAVRRRVQDPRAGRRIRELARKLGVGGRSDDEAVQQVLAAYRLERPNERMGAGRVLDALTVVPDPSCRQVSLSVIGDVAEVGSRWSA